MIQNAKSLPEIYFGLHMVEGVAEYRDPGVDPYRIYLGEEVLKQMDTTFSGKPMYVDHVDEVNIEKLQEEADGYVIESFFNKCDGKHWAKFIVVSERAKKAIREGWKLSNAYIPKSFTGGGLCHGVEYVKEVTMAEYEHLAIVKNPRYEESIILTPEQFKAYNEDKEQELLKVANSKGDDEMKFQFFKRAKVENAADVEGMSVTLPLSKMDKTVSECVEIADKFLNMQGYANGDHMVKVGEEEMSVNDMIKKFKKMNDEMAEEEAVEKKKNDEDKEGDLQKKPAKETGLATEKKKDNDDDDEDEKKKNDDDDEEMKEKKNKKKKNDDEEEMEKKKNDETEKEEKKKNALYFEALKNAPNTPIKDVVNFEMSEDKVSRGKSRYGSN